MVGRRKADHHLPPRMYEKHGSYYYVSRTNKWINLGRDLAIAKRKWAELDGSGPAAAGMAALMDRYLLEVVPTKAARTQQDNREEMQRLRAVFGAMEARDVRPMHVAKYLDLRGKQAPTRANREKALLSHVFTMAMRWGVTDTNPCKGVRRNPERPRERYITDEEYRAVWTQANSTVRGLMDLAYLTAQRIGDLIELRHADITQAGVRIVQNKTGAKLLVRMTPELRAVIDRITRIHPKVRGMTLLCTRTGQPYTYDGISSMFKRAVKAAGVSDFHFHDLRAKALTDARRAGQDAQRLAGHANETMTARYIKAREVEEVDPLRQIAV